MQTEKDEHQRRIDVLSGRIEMIFHHIPDDQTGKWVIVMMLSELKRRITNASPEELSALSRELVAAVNKEISKKFNAPWVKWVEEIAVGRDPSYYH